MIEAYGYARKKGLQIVNASLGGSVGSQAEYDALRVASQTLFVVAAGNGGSDQVGDNNDVTPTYPCAYNLPNILCVAATDQHDALASFSNYGSTAVDLAAPGVTIASSWPGGQWRYMNGTSMATPHVSGAAALVLAESPGATVAQVRAALLAGVDVKPSLTGKTVSGGRLNAFRALGGIPAALTSPPATTPSGSSPAPPAPAAPSSRPDTDALSIRVVAVRHVNRRVGMRVRTRCSEACRVTHELVVGSRTARRLGIRAAARPRARPRALPPDARRVGDRADQAHRSRKAAPAPRPPRDRPGPDSCAGPGRERAGGPPLGPALAQMSAVAGAGDYDLVP